MGVYSDDETALGDPLTALSTRLWMTELSLECFRLNTLDDLWTSYLGGATEATAVRADLPELQSIVSDMVALLGSVSRKAPRLASTISDSGIDLDAQLRLLTEQDQMLAERLSGIDLPSPLSNAVREACETVVRESPQELVELTGKLKLIANEQFAEGDLRYLKKAVVLMAIGAVLVGTPGGPILVPAAISYGLLTGSVTAFGALTWLDLDKKREGQKDHPTRKKPKHGDFKL